MSTTIKCLRVFRRKACFNSMKKYLITWTHVTCLFNQLHTLRPSPTTTLHYTIHNTLSQYEPIIFKSYNLTCMPNLYCYISHLPFYSKYESLAYFSSDLYESDKGLSFYHRLCCSVQVKLIHSYLKNCLD